MHLFSAIEDALFRSHGTLSHYHLLMNLALSSQLALMSISERLLNTGISVPNPSTFGLSARSDLYDGTKPR